MFTDKQLSKLRRPVHISYIQNNLLKTSKEETREVIDKYVEEGILEESKYAKDYYSLKQK